MIICTETVCGDDMVPESSVNIDDNESIIEESIGTAEESGM